MNHRFIAGAVSMALMFLLSSQLPFTKELAELDSGQSILATSGSSSTDFATFSDWSDAPLIVPTTAYKYVAVVNSSIVGVYTGEGSTPDGIGSIENRVSIIRDDGMDLTWYSESVELRKNWGDGQGQQFVSSHVLENGSMIVAVALCNDVNHVVEHQNSQGFDDALCFGSNQQESDGALIRIYGVSMLQNSTTDLGTVTYSDCGREPKSGGGSGGWSYDLFTPRLNQLAIFGNYSDFTIGLAHKHMWYDSTASNSAGWPNSNTAKCKIEFNGTELDTLSGDTNYVIDEITVDASGATLERHASNQLSAEKVFFGENGEFLWYGQVSGSGWTFNCELNDGNSVQLTNFTDAKTIQPGTRLLPGRVSTGSGDLLAMLDTTSCTIASTYSETTSPNSNAWTDFSGITHVIARNSATPAAWFGANVGVSSTWIASFSANGSLIRMDSTSLAPGDSHASDVVANAGFNAVGGSGSSNPPTILARDTDSDDVIDARDAFPFDPSESEDSDNDGHGDNADECPTQWGNSTVDRLGCRDRDGDGYSDQVDSFPFDNTQFMDTDSDGFGDNGFGNLPDACPHTYGTSTRSAEFGCPDADGDGWADQSDAFDADGSQWNDTDSDGFGDSLIGFQGDACPTVVGTSTRDRFGCADADGDGWSDDGDDFPAEPTQWSDRDLDGYGDNQTAGAALIDAFPGDTTQWNDTDGDGHGDNPYGTQGDWFPNDPSRWQDSDRDGVADEDDAFPNDASQREDSDGDGFGDDINGTNGDAFPDDPDEWADPDGDGYGSNVDAFPNDGSQWNDTDGDGHGDNPYGTEGDWFPNDSTRWQDSDRDGVADEDDAFDNDATQWNDTDGDGHGDNPSGTAADRFPDDPSRWQDSDRDGVADEDDAFPNDASQQADRDGDGYGDNPNGNRGDTFPDDATEWADTDADGTGNNADAFPFDPSQTSDADGDGFGDDPRGSGADRFPNDATQWSDIDGDGYGDNAEGTNPDAFIADPTQWSDADGDGYGDNPTGRQADAFPNEPTQWEDQDGDGFGDNQSGANPDPYLFDFDNDGYNDSIDPLPKLASPGDLDNDGTPDSEDAFPEDFREWADSDGDGEGDNADPDDDNDGWADTDELRQGTDPYSGASQPVDSFEIVIPGTQVGLGAWDLIGMFGGIPLFFWIMFGFATRNGRTARFEDELRAAQTRDELEHVALRWEFMLMLRMLGPHQGIRLERLRAELDDRFEAEGQNLSHFERHEADQTALVVESMEQDASVSSPEDKAVVELPEASTDSTAEPTSAAPTASVEAQKTDEQGYEWYTTEDGMNYYRVADSGDEWQPFDG